MVNGLMHIDKRENGKGVLVLFQVKPYLKLRFYFLNHANKE